jgi:hypothetical protein
MPVAPKESLIVREPRPTNFSGLFLAPKLITFSRHPPQRATTLLPAPPDSSLKASQDMPNPTEQPCGNEPQETA